MGCTHFYTELYKVVVFFSFLNAYYEVLSDMKQDSKFHSTTITILKHSTLPTAAHVFTNTKQVTKEENLHLPPFFLLTKMRREGKWNSVLSFSWVCYYKNCLINPWRTCVRRSDAGGEGGGGGEMNDNTHFQHISPFLYPLLLHSILLSLWYLNLF